MWLGVLCVGEAAEHRIVSPVHAIITNTSRLWRAMVIIISKKPRTR